MMTEVEITQRDHDAPTESLTNDAAARVGLETSVFSTSRILVTNNIVQEEVGSIQAGPWKRALERHAEVCHGPGKDGDVVTNDSKSVEDHGQTDSLGAVVDVVPGNDTAAAVGLSEGDFENQNRDADKEESDEVGDEELETVVVEHHGRESKKIAQAYSTSHGAQDELRSRVEVITAFVVLLRVRRQHEVDPLCHAWLRACALLCYRHVGGYRQHVSSKPMVSELGDSEPLITYAKHPPNQALCYAKIPASNPREVPMQCQCRVIS
ncbi:hypothetical protein HG530_008280 [Fusarium avenaceum]|nr:hypothetical protein HG530_008280 [Fusarium avenaceum]